MNPQDIAQLAITHLRPELLLLAAESAKGAAGESGKQVITWLRDRFKATAVEPAINNAVTHPNDERRLTLLKTHLELVLEENESLRHELSRFLASQPAIPTAANQTANAQGNQNKIAQVSGKKNSVQIS